MLVRGTPRIPAKAYVDGAMTGPGTAAKKILFRKMTAKATSFFHLGQSY
jgi:hypothetical protein